MAPVLNPEVLEKLPEAPESINWIGKAAGDDASQYNNIHDALSAACATPELVKGAGYVRGNKPLEDDGDIVQRLSGVQNAVAKATYQGWHDQATVRKGISAGFQKMLPSVFMNQAGSNTWANQMTNAVQSMAADLGKNFEIDSPLPSGFRPYNLLAPAMLIYPFMTPARNKFPRTQGQGHSIEGKLIVGIQGSQTGGSAGAPKSMFIPELPSGGGFGTWPNQLPPSGAQSAADVNIPYAFQGITEALTWLAQFESQGYQDLSGLANLILLQEAMLAEEYQLLASTAHNLTTPGTPLLNVRTAGTGEVALTGVTTNLYVRVTATNFTGETVSAVASAAVAAGKVVDVTIVNPPLAGLATNIYVGTGTADPGVAGSHIMASEVGGAYFTLQGAIPTTGATPPTADTGTGQANGYEGMLSVVSGHAAANSVYPSGFLGSYVNKSVGSTLSLAVLNAAMQAMWDGGTTATGVGGNSFTTAGGFRVSPADLWAEGSDVGNLSDDIVTNRAGQQYLLTVAQDQVSNITTGAAVGQVVNPVTRAIVKIMVHPWMVQGNCFINSYTLSSPTANVGNVWEVNNVQDYISISWPVIDMTFRYSIALYGALFCKAPQYNAVLGGLQRVDGNLTSTPFS